MEGLFFEAESAMNLRRSSFSSALSNNQSNLYGGFGFKSSQTAYNYSLLDPSIGSVRQLLLNTSNNNMMVAPAPASFRGGSIPATSLISLYSSNPPIPLHHRPPLLPLPMKSATMPSPPSAIRRSSSSAPRQSNQKSKKKKQQQQAKPSTNPKKEPAAAETAKIEEEAMENKQKPMPAIIAAEKKEEEEEETEEEFLFGSAVLSKTVSPVFSVSPPPSSLPLPRLLLMRPRRSAAVASSCNAEAMAGVDAGATDDLRKLLRL